jgi:hypothetical protein
MGAFALGDKNGTKLNNHTKKLKARYKYGH